VTFQPVELSRVERAWADRAMPGYVLDRMRFEALPPLTWGTFNGPAWGSASSVDVWLSTKLLSVPEPEKRCGYVRKVLAHELAHTLTPEALPKHGPTFLALFCVLLARLNGTFKAVGEWLEEYDYQDTGPDDYKKAIRFSLEHWDGPWSALQVAHEALKATTNMLAA